MQSQIDRTNLKKEFRQELEKTLAALTRDQGEEFARQIKSIIITNMERGRLQTFTDGNPTRIQAYIWIIAQTYSRLKPFIHQLQIERDSTAWAPLYERMQTWAYNFFLKKNFRADDRTREIAIECATEAAATLLKSHFPYDTEFDPWAHVIVQNTCRKYIHRSLRKSVVPEDKKIKLDDELADPHDHLLESSSLQKEAGQELLEALNQLSEARRTVIQLIYFEELSFEETARRMGKTVGAIYSLQFHALHELRKILGTNRDKHNEQ